MDANFEFHIQIYPFASRKFSKVPFVGQVLAANDALGNSTHSVPAYKAMLGGQKQLIDAIERPRPPRGRSIANCKWGKSAFLETPITQDVLYWRPHVRNPDTHMHICVAKRQIAEQDLYVNVKTMMGLRKSTSVPNACAVPRIVAVRPFKCSHRRM